MSVCFPFFLRSSQFLQASPSDGGWVGFGKENFVGSKCSTHIDGDTRGPGTGSARFSGSFTDGCGICLPNYETYAV